MEKKKDPLSPSLSLSLSLSLFVDVQHGSKERGALN